MRQSFFEYLELDYDSKTVFWFNPTSSSIVKFLTFYNTAHIQLVYCCISIIPILRRRILSKLIEINPSAIDKNIAYLKNEGYL